MSLEGNIKTGFGLIFIANIILFGLIIWGIVAGVKYVKNKGLKNVVETVWEGTNSPPPTATATNTPAVTNSTN